MTPTAEEAAFLAKICAEPDDETHRLVYADWLQEHGRDARAELIRLQHELVSRFPERARIVPLEDLTAVKESRRAAHIRIRCKAILDQIFPELWPWPFRDRDSKSQYTVDDDGLTVSVEGTLARHARSDHGAQDRITVGFEAGLIRSVVCSPRQFDDRSRDLFLRHPITFVRLAGASLWLASGNGPRCRFCVSDEPVVSTPGNISVRIHRFCKSVWYDSAEDAWAELSRACVAYGRSLTLEGRAE